MSLLQKILSAPTKAKSAPVLRVLILDDEPTYLNIHSETLAAIQATRQGQYTIEWKTASTADDADNILQIDQWPADLLLLDYDLGSSNGALYCAKIKRHGIVPQNLPANLYLTAEQSSVLFEPLTISEAKDHVDILIPKQGVTPETLDSLPLLSTEQKQLLRPILYNAFNDYAQLNNTVVHVVSGKANDPEIQRIIFSVGAERPLAKAIAGTVMRDTYANDVFERILNLRQAQKKQKLLEQLGNRYLRAALVRSILENGALPPTIKAFCGVGYLDIVHFSSLIRTLAPEEQRTLVSGILAVCNHVIESHGGISNKHEGDSLMFQFGGPLDSVLGPNQAPEEIAIRLAKACIEIQRRIFQFNQLDLSLLDVISRQQNRQEVESALSLVQQQRFISGTYNPEAFQIHLRLGGDVGLAVMGDIGPEGLIQYDLNGDPGVNARRMEATSPVDGVRFTKTMYDLLETTGFPQEYVTQFRAEAKGGTYSEITVEEAWKKSRVYIEEKQGIAFDTFSVQVNPQLPETVAAKIRLLLGNTLTPTLVSEILKLIEYNRGNTSVILAIEKVFTAFKIVLPQEQLLELLATELNNTIIGKLSMSEVAAVKQQFSLSGYFHLLGAYQDELKRDYTLHLQETAFTDSKTYIEQEFLRIEKEHKTELSAALLKRRFEKQTLLKVMTTLKAALLHYQQNDSMQGPGAI